MMNRSKKILIRTLIIFIAWLVLVKLRPMIILPHCAADPSLCASSGVNRLDRSAMGGNSSMAEDLSTATQWIMGFFAFTLPWIFWLNRRSVGRWIFALEDFLTVAQVVALNGFFTELIRLVVQRPRPYVYENPSFYGQELQNYTSFVSGHTSFSTATAAALVVILVYRRASRKLVVATATLGGLVAISTAVLRVFAGRHFVTDVLAGLLCGLLSAAIVAAISRRDDRAIRLHT